MSGITTTTGWADGRSFSARLFALDGTEKIPVSHLAKFYTPTLRSGGLEHTTLDDGWLTLKPNQAAMTLRFQYHSKTPDRLHFMLSLDSDRHRNLGISRNHYLGLYKHSRIDDFWKIEPLAWGNDTLRCRMRDHQGRQVKVQAGPPYYLTVGEGNAHEFLIMRTP